MFDKKVDLAKRYGVKRVVKRRAAPIPKLTPHPFKRLSRSTLRTTSAGMQHRSQVAIIKSKYAEKNYQERLGKWYRDNL